MGAQLELRSITKYFADVLAVDDVSLTIRRGEFLTLLGPSGSGKTTTLNMIAGFEAPTSGQILLEDRDITMIPPNKRNIGMVFQNYALFPHMTVFDNVAFPLKMRRESPSKIREKVNSALELVRLSGLQKRYPNQLSGGQQQRVALARAIVFMPPILLMDEPLGALDKKLRDHMRLEIKHLQESLEITVIYVTHDQEEALTMSDRIAIMNNGNIVQVGTPAELYESPVNRFVADFIGESNFLEGRVIQIEGNQASVETREGLTVWVENNGTLRHGDEVNVAIRPEKIQILSDEPSPSPEIINRFSGRVKEVIYVGEASIYKISLGQDKIVTVKVQNSLQVPRHRPGEQVVIGWRMQNGLTLQ